MGNIVLLIGSEQFVLGKEQISYLKHHIG